MRKASTLIMIALLALAGACSQDQKTTVAAETPRSEASAPQQQASASHELTPEQLGELGAQIRKTPDRAEDLLKEHGLTQQTFEAQIRKVTESADASKRYAEAYRKASA